MYGRVEPTPLIADAAERPARIAFAHVDGAAGGSHAARTTRSHAASGKPDKPPKGSDDPREPKPSRGKDTVFERTPGERRTQRSLAKLHTVNVAEERRAVRELTRGGNISEADAKFLQENPKLLETIQRERERVQGKLGNGLPQGAHWSLKEGKKEGGDLDTLDRDLTQLRADKKAATSQTDKQLIQEVIDQVAAQRAKRATGEQNVLADVTRAYRAHALLKAESVGLEQANASILEKQKDLEGQMTTAINVFNRAQGKVEHGFPRPDDKNATIDPETVVRYNSEDMKHWITVQEDGLAASALDRLAPLAARHRALQSELESNKERIEEIPDELFNIENNHINPARESLSGSTVKALDAWREEVNVAPSTASPDGQTVSGDEGDTGGKGPGKGAETGGGSSTRAAFLAAIQDGTFGKNLSYQKPDYGLSNQKQVVYVVQPGDSVWSITHKLSEQHGISWEQAYGKLVQSLPNPNLIHPNDALVINGLPDTLQQRYKEQLDAQAR